MWTMIPSLDALVQSLAPALTLPSFGTAGQLLLAWVMCLGKHTLRRVAQRHDHIIAVMVAAIDIDMDHHIVVDDLAQHARVRGAVVQHLLQQGAVVDVVEIAVAFVARVLDAVFVEVGAVLADHLRRRVQRVAVAGVMVLGGDARGVGAEILVGGCRADPDQRGDETAGDDDEKPVHESKPRLPFGSTLARAGRDRHGQNWVRRIAARGCRAN